SLPTKGLPLPFISYGGTSLVMSLFSAGVLANISARNPEPGEGLLPAGRRHKAANRRQPPGPELVIEVGPRSPRTDATPPWRPASRCACSARAAERAVISIPASPWPRR